MEKDVEFLRMLPHLPVTDLDAEVSFYRLLGFVVYLRSEGFTSVEYGDGATVHFGLTLAGAAPPKGLEWKLEVDDVAAAMRLAEANHLEILSGPRLHWFRQPSAQTVPPTDPSQRPIVDTGRWRMQLRTPNNYVLTLESTHAAPPASP